MVGSSSSQERCSRGARTACSWRRDKTQLGNPLKALLGVGVAYFRSV